jgi:hypothetical protein
MTCWTPACIPRSFSERREPMPSSNYRLFEQAMRGRKPIFCVYEGYRRELCPIVLGHSQRQEKVLTYQFGGQSKSGLPPGGEWRCLWLSKVSAAQLGDGPWRTGSSHTQPQGCVEIVDLDVNPDSPYRPKRALLRRSSSHRAATRSESATRGPTGGTPVKLRPPRGFAARRSLRRTRDPHHSS